MLDEAEPDVAAITARAEHAATVLSRLTSLQREVTLSSPLVALANNIAMDCRTVFENDTALARWRAQLVKARATDESAGSGGQIRLRGGRLSM
jgi:hypothetical protein